MSHRTAVRICGSGVKSVSPNPHVYPRLQNAIFADVITVSEGHAGVLIKKGRHRQRTPCDDRAETAVTWSQTKAH